MKWVFISFIVVSVAQAKVVEVTNMKDALAEVDANTLAIFDLDNTVMMPAQTLGGEEWYDYLVEKYTESDVKAGVPEKEARSKAMDRALSEWNAVQMVSDASPVEADAPGLIAQAQKLGAKTLGLTARPKELIGVTHRQLKGIGIEFSKAAISNKSFTIQANGPRSYDKGIMFCGTKVTKGEVITKLLDKLKLKPKKIIFVDNKLHHVENVEKALEGRGIEYIGFRHGAADKKIEAFNKGIADVQHKYFGRILDDKAAAAIQKN